MQGAMIDGVAGVAYPRGEQAVQVLRYGMATDLSGGGNPEAMAGGLRGPGLLLYVPATSPGRAQSCVDTH